MIVDCQMIEKFQNDLKNKDEEINVLKVCLIEFKIRVKFECIELKEKFEKVNSVNGRLDEKLLQMIEENGVFKRKFEEDFECLIKKV